MTSLRAPAAAAPLFAGGLQQPYLQEISRMNYLSLNHCVGHLKRRFSRELGLCQKVFWQEFIGSKVLLVKPKKGMIDLLRLGF